jgi:hypothetical protein
MEFSTGVDYAAVSLTVASEAPAACELRSVTTEAGRNDRAVWFDYRAGEVWHGRRSQTDGVWHLDREPAAAAEGWIAELVGSALDRLAEPSQYAAHWDAERRYLNDLDALNELQAVQLAALWSRVGELPKQDQAAAVDRMICTAMDGPEADTARLAVLRARNLAVAYGDDDRAVAAAAKVLRTSHTAVRRVLAARIEHAGRVRMAAMSPGAMVPGEGVEPTLSSRLGRLCLPIARPGQVNVTRTLHQHYRTEGADRRSCDGSSLVSL